MQVLHAALQSHLIQMQLMHFRRWPQLPFVFEGCVKNAVVVWIGVVQGDNLTVKEAAGYVLSLVGFLVYTVLRAALPHHAKQS